MPDRSFSSLGAPGNSGGGNPAASVPLSVYRQQTAEMEQLKATLASTQGENDHLRQQNQDLIAAIEKFVSSAVELGESTSTLPMSTPAPQPVTAPIPQTPPIAPLGAEQLFGESLDFTDPSAGNPLPNLDAVGDLMADPSVSGPAAVTVDPGEPSVLESNRWFSLLGIVVIAVIAFGISFALVGVFRPNNQSNPAAPDTPESTESLPPSPPPAPPASPAP